jgi:hypothetical protein
MSENNLHYNNDLPPLKKGVSVIHRINYLREKAGGSRHNGGGKLDDVALAKAQNAINNFAPAYPAMAGQDIDELIEQVRLLEIASPTEHHALLTKIAFKANEIQSLGGTFDYELISTIGRSLRMFAEGLESANNHHIIIIHAHVDTLRVVLARKIKGYGGIDGRALLNELMRVLEHNGGHDSAKLIQEILGKIPSD